MATRPLPHPASSTVAGAKTRTKVASPCTSAPPAARASKRAWYSLPSKPAIGADGSNRKPAAG